MKTYLSTVQFWTLLFWAMVVLTLVLISPACRAGEVKFDDIPAGYTDGSVYAKSQGIWLLTPIGSIQELAFIVEANDNAVSPPNIAMGPIIGVFWDYASEGQFNIPTDSLSFWVIATTAGNNDPWTINFYTDILPPGDNWVMWRGDPIMSITGRGKKQLVSIYRPERDIIGFELITSSRNEGIDNVTWGAPQP